MNQTEDGSGGCAEDLVPGHGLVVYAFGYDAERYEFLLDVDYYPEEDKKGAGDREVIVSIAPSEMVFHNVYDIRIDLRIFEKIQVEKISRSSARTPRNAKYIHADSEWDWRIESNAGEICFWSTGYSLAIRNQVKLKKGEAWGVRERGGLHLVSSVGERSKATLVSG